jgi:NADH-quinone oxidoreductase subunit G
MIELSRPELSVAVRDIDGADVVLVLGTDPLHSSPILDLRIRKAMRRSGTRLCVAGDRPTALDGGAAAVRRYPPGGEAAFLAELNSALAAAHRDGEEPGEESAAIAALLHGAERPVIVWGERIARGQSGASAVDALLAMADGLGLAGVEGAGLLGIPETTNARGLREVGCLPHSGPGYVETAAGSDSDGIKKALGGRELGALILFGADPVRDHPDATAWQEGLRAARFVLAFAMFEDASAAHADVILPLQSHAEKEGTVTHPDGRLQRVRPSVQDPGDIRPGWQALCELSAALGDETGFGSVADVLAAIADAVPIYAGITAEEIGGRGVRWQERGAAANLPTVKREVAPEEPAAPANGLLLGTYRDLWAGPVTELNPALRFLAPSQRVELSTADAERLGLGEGDGVTVSANGTGVGATVAIRERMPEGACFLVEGTAENNANVLANRGPRAVEIESRATNYERRATSG